MDELIEWLNFNKISFNKIDNEVIDIEDFGKMFFTDLSNVHSIFRENEYPNTCLISALLHSFWRLRVAAIVFRSHMPIALCPRYFAFFIHKLRSPDPFSNSYGV